MQHLFTPWRFKYVTQVEHQKGCVLCQIAAADPAEDESLFVLQRAKQHFLVLNIYPYTSGHMMIVPYEHCGPRDCELQVSQSSPISPCWWRSS